MVESYAHGTRILLKFGVLQEICPWLRDRNMMGLVRSKFGKGVPKIDRYWGP